MRSRTCTLLIAAAMTAAAQPPQNQAQAVAAIRANYTKFEYRIPMRDGVRLFTAVYVPKDVFTDGKTYPIMLERTPYSVPPYGVDQYPARIGPSELFEREKFIFALEDVRGRYMSEGEYVVVRPYNPAKKGPGDIDESSDTFDTIDWLLKHVPGNTGKVGMWGISQPGFFATAGLIDAHPALVAVSPQAPVTDYYLGDDVYHNGAFMLAHRFSFYAGFRPREGAPEPPQPSLPFRYGTPDAYAFFLNLGPLANADTQYFKDRQPYWDMNVAHTTYDQTWQSRSIWKYLAAVKPAVLLVGGWYDTEDPQGLLRQFDFMEQHSPPPLTLVMGPWNHGGFSRGAGDRLGNVNFGSSTARYYREKIELPFFVHYLKGDKGAGEAKFPKAWLFQTGLNQWRRFDAWPPPEAKPAELFLAAGGKLAFEPPHDAGFDEYLSDPNRPVPYIGRVSPSVLSTYMTEDQRFAATRPDVLVFQTPPLERDVTIFGPVGVDLKVSTTGTDSDFDVKLIDVYPGEYPDYNNPAAAQQPQRGAPPAAVPMGAYQQLIRGEPFRGKFRESFEKPVPFHPGVPGRIAFRMPDIAHTFRAGHRIMVQIQSSWFPLTDRNPQTFCDIPNARPADFVKATQRVYWGGTDGSRLRVRIIE
jgi:putative CocE/NonD family hydrolase